MIFPSEPLPRRLDGWSLWLEVRHDGAWVAIASLNRQAGKDIVRWLERHPGCTDLRIRAVQTGSSQEGRR
jgi:hypothetical protein